MRSASFALRRPRFTHNVLEARSWQTMVCASASTPKTMECATLEVCCMQAGAEFDMDNQTCLTSDEQMMSTSGDGLACMTDDDCAMDFPRCELDATRMGTCTVECRSNDDCTDGPNGDFCQANSRCASAPDGTCQIETPDEPETANPECDGTTPICMPLSMGASSWHLC